MKRILQALGTVGFAIAMLCAKKAHAADAETTARFIDKITVAPVAALKTVNISGEKSFGAGLDLGFSINDFVSLHGSAIGFEDNSWRGRVVDESEFYAKADFAKFKNESFVLYGKGGVVRDWEQERWGLGVGLGGELKFTKNISLAADYTIRPYFAGEKDSLARALVNLSF